ncbi:MAG TPA: TonB C-terminal domain-containing protein [Blastocatellia bacterium]|jgi:outer membrane biosynthesis protein TonB|nr:TonB C-terminal domain-containing protein [Blastocatellia bacterium]
MVAPAQVYAAFWFDRDEQDRFFRCLGRTLSISLALHVVALLVMMGIRLAPHGERPLAAVEVTLVNLPTPVKTIEQPRPVEPVKRTDARPSPAPAPPVKTAAPAATPVSVPARTSVTKDILKDLELPPDAPKFGELTPAKAVAQPRPQAPAKVQVPDLPRIPDVMPDQAVKTPQRSSISEELNRELEEELKKVKEYKPAAKLEIPKEAPVKPVPQQEAAIPQVKGPQTQLKTSGTSGTNPFWGRVEAIIKSQWEPPPIDVMGQTYSAVIRFRYYRNGTVKDVAIQQTSGNSYFDMAGQRAVLKPRQFPVFPADMTEAYQDVEMVFRVGESVG